MDTLTTGGDKPPHKPMTWRQLIGVIMTLCAFPALIAVFLWIFALKYTLLIVTLFAAAVIVFLHGIYLYGIDMDYRPPRSREY